MCTDLRSTANHPWHDRHCRPYLSSAPAPLIRLFAFSPITPSSHGLTDGFKQQPDDTATNCVVHGEQRVDLAIRRDGTVAASIIDVDTTSCSRPAAGFCGSSLRFRTQRHRTTRGKNAATAAPTCRRRTQQQQQQQQQQRWWCSWRSSTSSRDEHRGNGTARLSPARASADRPRIE